MSEPVDDIEDPFPFCIKEVKSVSDVSYLSSALQMLHKSNFPLKINIFKEEQFKHIYNKCIETAEPKGKFDPFISQYIVHEYPETMNTEKYEDIISIFSTFFRASFSLLKFSDKEQYLLVPWTWRTFILCNPLHTEVYIGRSKDILDHLYSNHLNQTYSIIHYV
jgi:hypothetical protein